VFQALATKTFRSGRKMQDTSKPYGKMNKNMKTVKGFTESLLPMKSHMFSLRIGRGPWIPLFDELMPTTITSTVVFFDHTYCLLNSAMKKIQRINKIPNPPKIEQFNFV
jgi:hypothetical protein